MNLPSFIPRDTSHVERLRAKRRGVTPAFFQTNPPPLYVSVRTSQLYHSRQLVLSPLLLVHPADAAVGNPDFPSWDALRQSRRRSTPRSCTEGPLRLSGAGSSVLLAASASAPPSPKLSAPTQLMVACVPLLPRRKYVKSTDSLSPPPVILGLGLPCPEEVPCPRRMGRRLAQPPWSSQVSKGAVPLSSWPTPIYSTSKNSCCASVEFALAGMILSAVSIGTNLSRCRVYVLPD